MEKVIENNQRTLYKYIKRRRERKRVRASEAVTVVCRSDDAIGMALQESELTELTKRGREAGRRAGGQAGRQHEVVVRMKATLKIAQKLLLMLFLEFSHIHTYNLNIHTHMQTHTISSTFSANNNNTHDINSNNNPL